MRDRLIDTACNAYESALPDAAYLTQTGRRLSVEGAPGLGALMEGRAALSGEVGRGLRTGGDGDHQHPIAAISRDTG